MIGPGKPIDTNRFLSLASINLGGCHGSTAPPASTRKPASLRLGFPAGIGWTGYKPRRGLADLLGIQQWAAVIGGSLGGMQALRWSISFPERVRHCSVIASAPN